MTNKTTLDAADFENVQRIDERIRNASKLTPKQLVEMRNYINRWSCYIKQADFINTVNLIDPD